MNEAVAAVGGALLGLLIWSVLSVGLTVVWSATAEHFKGKA